MLATEFHTTTLPPTIRELDRRLDGRDWFCGSKMTWVDLFAACYLKEITLQHEGSLDAVPRLKKHVEKIAKLPQIEKWLKERPDSMLGGHEASLCVVQEKEILSPRSRVWPDPGCGRVPTCPGVGTQKGKPTLVQACPVPRTSRFPSLVSNSQPPARSSATSTHQLLSNHLSPPQSSERRVRAGGLRPLSPSDRHPKSCLKYRTVAPIPNSQLSPQILARTSLDFRKFGPHAPVTLIQYWGPLPVYRLLGSHCLHCSCRGILACWGRRWWWWRGSSFRLRSHRRATQKYDEKSDPIPTFPPTLPPSLDCGGRTPPPGSTSRLALISLPAIVKLCHVTHTTWITLREDEEEVIRLFKYFTKHKSAWSGVKGMHGPRGPQRKEGKAALEASFGAGEVKTDAGM
ncbi:Hematopoietic prostaglandin D synthase [Portunus trituberculatus]|uniref:Hematopoietic prostaglandin D synthase n=1 Tax=Portunus trituberculatus TaxID=210409 RepID=A0A5B7G945_PORTR|nr:Hematopoietic prostaglandin D synthase [Portunus trituberculatus]